MNGDLHGMGHFAQYNKHSLMLNVKTQRLYCYGCRDEVPIDDNHPAFAKIRECVKEVNLILNGPSDVDAAADVKFQGDANEDDDYSRPASAVVLKETGPGGVLQGVKGLHNVGNTCFYNSIMQNIAQTLPIRERFVVSREGKPAAKITEGPATAELRQFMISMWSSSERVFSPANLLNAVGKKYAQFRKRHQQDSHELLMCLLDLLSSEEKKILEIVQKAKAEVALKQAEAVSSSVTESLEEPSALEETATDEQQSSDEPQDVVPSETSSSTDPPPPTDPTATSTLPPQSEVPAAPADQAELNNQESGHTETTEASRPPSGDSPVAAIAATSTTAPQDSAPETSPAADEQSRAPQQEEQQPPDNQAPAETQAAARAIPSSIPLLPKSISPAAWAKMLQVEQILSTDGVDQIFGGELESRITCHVCENRSTIYESVNNLSLPIPSKMISTRYLAQLGAESNSGPSKRGRGARGAKDKGPEYPMKDEGGKVSKKERARLFRLQQERDEKETTAKSQEEVKSAQSTQQPAESSQGSATQPVHEAESSNQGEKHCAASSEVVNEAPSASDESSPDLTKTDAPPEAAETVLEIPAPAIVEERTDPGVAATQVQLTADEPQKPAETQKTPATESTSAAEAVPEPPSMAATSSPAEPDAPHTTAGEADPAPAVEQPAVPSKSTEELDELGEELGVTPAPSGPSESEEDKAMIEGHSNVYDGRSMADEPAMRSLEACLASFTEAELLHERIRWGCYNCTKRAWVRHISDFLPIPLTRFRPCSSLPDVKFSTWFFSAVQRLSRRRF